MTMTQVKAREAVGVFDDLASMEEAIEKLEISGFDRRHISVLGSEEAVERQYGRLNVSTEKLEDDPAAPRAILPRRQEFGIATGVLIGGGIYAGAVTAILAADNMAVPGGLLTVVLLGSLAGGLLGTLMAGYVGNEYKRFFNDQLKNGGILLWVKTPDSDKEDKALHVLQEQGARDVHIHEIPMRAA